MTDAERRAFNDKQNRNRAARLARMSVERLERFRALVRKRGIEGRNAVRDKVFLNYGGYVCACCGEKERKFLSLDHINNDGGRQRRELRFRTPEQMNRWIVRNGFPGGFQVLCMNCNWGKRQNNGVCPHTVRCNDYPEREYGQAAGSTAPL